MIRIVFLLPKSLSELFIKPIKSKTGIEDNIDKMTFCLKSKVSSSIICLVFLDGSSIRKRLSSFTISNISINQII